MANVLYYSMTGNTKKMANAIAEELGVEAMDVKKTEIIPDGGILFIGSGCYGGQAGEDMSKFIGKNEFTGRKVALFGTSGGGEGREVNAMAEALKKKGATVLGTYNTKGKAFVIINIGHPNKDELDGARKFAREMAKLG
jgi:flavodoxin I